jgi:hypothetical protein
MQPRRVALVALSSLSIASASGCHGGGGGAGGAGGGGGGNTQPPQAFTCEHAGSVGKDYEVGPGAAYATLGAVPWESLGPGDSVRIHPQEGGYHEKFLLSTRGTEKDPIVVCGIPDAAGKLPVIDAADATSRPQLNYGDNTGIETSSLVAVFNHLASAPGGKRPGYVTLANLELRGARQGAFYTSTTGVKLPYSSLGPAAVNVFGADHVSLVGNALTDSDQGLFVNSKDYLAPDGYDYAQSRDILVRGNVFTDNGIPNDYLVHHAYTEAIGIVYEYNLFGRLKDHALGNAISDRSAGTVIRYNSFDGGAHFATIENPQASWGNVEQNLAKDPSLRLTYVYGNVFLDRHNPGVDTGDKDPPDQYSGYASKLFMYGGTDQNYPSYRNGTLFFYNNTVVIKSDQAKHYNTVLFEVYTDPATPLAARVDVRNNVFVVLPETAGAPATAFYLEVSTNSNFGVGNQGQGDFNFDANWITHGWAASQPKSQYYDPTTAHIVTTATFDAAPGTDPGFVDLAGGDFHLKAKAQAVDRGIALDPAVVAAGQGVNLEYVSPGVGAARPLNGKAIDLGAFEGP